MPTARGSSKRARRSSSASRRRHHGAVDWFVPIPQPPNRRGDSATRVWCSQVLQRAQELGYAQIAWTHTVYGRPQHPRDAAATAIPASLVPNRTTTRTKQQQQQQPSGCSTVQVLRRLNIVVETLSDTGLYTTTSTTTNNTNNTNPLAPIHALLQDYDLVSLQPRNEACFQAACCCPTPVFDILTLDSSLLGCGKIRTADLESLFKKRVAVEVCYAPAIFVPCLDGATARRRRQWVQTCRALHTSAASAVRQHHASSPSLLLLLLLSSGPVSTENNNQATSTTGRVRSEDAPPILLRSPADLTNVLRTVCGWNESVARAANTTVGAVIWERAQQRRSVSSYHNINNGAAAASLARTGGGVRIQSVTLVDVDDNDDDDDPSERLGTAADQSSGQRNRNKRAASTGRIMMSHHEKDEVQATAGLSHDQDPSSFGDAEREATMNKEDDGNDGFIAF